MFREMRRIQQDMPEEKCLAVLKRGTSGVLALLGDNEYPYAVPLSYVYDNGKVYFHCAKLGHKLDALKNSDKCSFCVIDKDKIVPEEYTTYFRSVILFGRLRIITEDTEKRHAIEFLSRKYAPREPDDRTQAAIEKAWLHMCLLELRVEHMSGKEAIELVKAGTSHS